MSLGKNIKRENVIAIVPSFKELEQGIDKVKKEFVASVQRTESAEADKLLSKM